jgi:predicted DNA-binding transcriptional regulator AlpA
MESVMNAITIKQVVKKVSLGQSTIYKMVSEGRFRKPFQLAPNRNAWAAVTKVADAVAVPPQEVGLRHISHTSWSN